MTHRIPLSDTAADIFVEMSDGNPGTMGCVSEILKDTANIDSDNFAGPLGPLLSLDM